MRTRLVLGSLILAMLGWWAVVPIRATAQTGATATSARVTPDGPASWGDAPLRLRPTEGLLAAPLREAPEPVVDFVDVSADVTPLDARGGLDVRLYLTLAALNAPLSRLALPARGLVVRGVRIMAPPANPDTKPDSLEAPPVRLEFLVVDDSLVVFPDSIPAGERFTLLVDYAAPEGPVMRSTLGPRGGCCSWTNTVRTGGESWLPIPLDPPDRFTAEVRVRPRRTLQVIVGGRREPTRPAYRFDRPVRADQLVLAVTSSRPIVLSGSAMPVAYFGAEGRETALRAFHRDFEASLEFVTRATGYTLPYDTLRVLFGETQVSGLAGAGLVVANRALLADDTARKSNDPLPRIAELAARLWTVGVMAESSWTDAWVVEALSGWLSVAIVSSRRGEGEAAALMQDRLAAYFAEAGRYRRPLVWDRWDHPADLLDAHATGRGTGILHMLHGLVGDAPFRAALRRLFATASEVGAGTENLRMALETTSGRPFSGFFDSWVYSAGHPQIRVTSRFDLADDRLHIELAQIQSGDMVPAVFPIETDARWMTLGAEGSTPVAMTQALWTWSSVIGIEPRFVLVDADRRIPAEIETQTDLSGLTAVVRYGPVAARLSAARDMAGFADDPALPLAIRLAMERETEGAVRRLLTSLASGIPRGGSLEGLVKRSWTDRDARVRTEAVRAAAAFAGDPAWEAFVRDDATRDSSAAVLAAAVETLAAMGSTDAGYIARSAIITDSFAEMVRHAGFRILARDSSMTVAERRKTLLDHSAPDLDTEHVIAALRLAEAHGPDRALQERVFDLLEHSSYRVRTAAARAAAWLLAPRDVPQLERRLRSETDPAVQAALGTTLARLRAG